MAESAEKEITEISVRVGEKVKWCVRVCVSVCVCVKWRKEVRMMNEIRQNQDRKFVIRNIKQISASIRTYARTYIPFVTTE